VLSYHLHEAVRNLRRAPSTALLTIFVLGIGLGLAVLMAGLAHVLSGDPLAGRGEKVFQVHTGAEALEPYQLRYSDASALARVAPGRSVLVGSRGFTSIRQGRTGDDFGQAPARGVNSQFFSVFDVPFVEGGPWLTSDDVSGSPLTVVTEALAVDLYGSAKAAIGQTVVLGGSAFLVSGVISRSWAPAPKFFDMESGFFSKPEDVFLPLSAIPRLGEPEKTFITFTCPSGAEFPTAPTLLSSQCLWVTTWFELTSDEQKSIAANRVDQFKIQGGRRAFSPASLDSSLAIIKMANVVPESVTIYSHLSWIFLVLCLMNTSGLLLARYLRRTKELGVRRALGATRSAVALHLITESTSITVFAGAFAVVVCWLGVTAAQHMPFEYARLVQFNWLTLILLIALSLLSGAFCAAVPAIIAATRAPASLVRSGS